MGITVDVMNVVGVLLEDGTWHPVDPASFQVGDFKFTRSGAAVVHDPKTAGFRFTENHKPIIGPLSSIRAVRTNP